MASFDYSEEALHGPPVWVSADGLTKAYFQSVGETDGQLTAVSLHVVETIDIGTDGIVYVPREYTVSFGRVQEVRLEDMQAEQQRIANQAKAGVYFGPVDRIRRLFGGGSN